MLTFGSRSWSEKPPVGTYGRAGHLLHPRHAWLMNDGVPGSGAGAQTPALCDLGTHAIHVPPTTWISTNLAWVPSARWGTALRITDNTSAWCEWADSSRFLTAGAQFSMVLGYRKTDGTARVSQAFGASGEVAAEVERCHVHLPYSDGTVYWDYGGFTDGTSRVSVAGLTFGDDVWVFTTGGIGMQIWQNGILRASNSGGVTRTQTAAAGLITTNDLAEHGFVYLYHRQLSPTECQQISVDPFCWLRRGSIVATRRASAGAPTGGKIVFRNRLAA